MASMTVFTYSGWINPPTNLSIAAYLTRLREQAGLTQQQLAERMGCTQSKVSKIEAMEDKNLMVRDVLKYAGALGYEMTVLFGENERAGLADAVAGS